MINNVTLVGRIAKEIDLSFLPGGEGKAVAKFTLAVDKNYKNKEGKYDTNFIPCVVFGKPAETIANYCEKGKLLGVTGEISTRSYEKDGSKRYVTEINVSGFQILEWPEKNKSNAHEDYTPVESDQDGDCPF